VEESNEAKCITVPVLFFSGEEVAKIEICSDWTALALKKAIRPFLGKGSAVSALIHEGEVLADTDSLKHLTSHVHVTLRKCAFLVEGAGAETVNGFYVRTKGRDLCDAPVYVNDNGILLFKYRMARGTDYWYFSREGDLSRSDGDFYRVKSDQRTAVVPPLVGWTFEACPLGRRTQVPNITFCGDDEEDSTDSGTSSDGERSVKKQETQPQPPVLQHEVNVQFPR